MAGWQELRQELLWTLKEVFSFLKTGLKNPIWAEPMVPGLMTSQLDLVESMGVEGVALPLGAVVICGLLEPWLCPT